MAAATDSATSLAYDDEGAGTPVVLPPRPDVRPPHLAADHRAPRWLRAEHCDRPARARRERRGAGPARRGRRPGARACSVHWRLTARSWSATRCRVGWPPSTRPPIRAAASLSSTTDPTSGPSPSSCNGSSPHCAAPGFTEVWQTFEDSLGLERIPEPVRSLVLETHEVKQDVVVGYWETVLRTDPDELQAFIDAQHPSARRALPRRLRAADHRQRARAVRMAARRATRGMGRRRPLRSPRRSRSLCRPATPVRRPLRRRPTVSSRCLAHLTPTTSRPGARPVRGIAMSASGRGREHLATQQT